MTEGIEAVKEAKEFISKIKPALTINRIPEKTLTAFKELSSEDFCEDYGMTLKFLLDFYFGAIGKGYERAEMKAELALEQISELRSQLEEKKSDKTIKFLDGHEKVIK